MRLVSFENGVTINIDSIDGIVDDLFDGNVKIYCGGSPEAFIVHESYDDVTMKILERAQSGEKI